jgi:hypothetical protein
MMGFAVVHVTILLILGGLAPRYMSLMPMAFVNLDWIGKRFGINSNTKTTWQAFHGVHYPSRYRRGCQGVARCDAGEYDRRGEGSHKGAVKVV